MFMGNDTLGPNQNINFELQDLLNFPYITLWAGSPGGVVLSFEQIQRCLIKWLCY